MQAKTKLVLLNLKHPPSDAFNMLTEEMEEIETYSLGFASSCFCSSAALRQNLYKE